MNYEQLSIEYWCRIYPMVQEYNAEHGTDLKPWECVKYEGANNHWDEEHPRFDGPEHNYEFAAAILEGKPVFTGDIIYSREGRTYSVKKDSRGFFAQRIGDILWRGNVADWGYFTLQPPKRTFTLDGVELPRPVKSVTEYGVLIGRVLDAQQYFFSAEEDKETWLKFMAEKLREARDGE